jgi:replicative DNA helicase
MQISRSRAKNETARREERAESKEVLKTADSDNVAQVISEQVVLGCLIEDPELLTDILTSGIAAEHFLLSDHVRAFEAILALHRNGAPIDTFSVADELGGDQNAFALMGQLVYGVVVESKHARYHATRVMSNARARQLLRIGEWIPQGLADLRDPDLLIAEIRDRLDRA